MYWVRQIANEDTDAVLRLAELLGSFNLPPEKEPLQEQIRNSVSAFQNPNRKKSECIYMFVLENLKTGEIVGTSLAFAKHGTPDDPHTFLRVLSKEFEDPALNIKINQQLLRFEYDTDGPSEIGGLILHPNFRKKEGLGKFLSYARFMYMGMNLSRFEKAVIAELLPPFNSDGSSELWEAFGCRFTKMSYREADRISRVDRDFIRNLFPQEDIYTSLFSEKAQAVIGQTGDPSKPVKHLLEKIGFRYLHAVDPFDGGPHFGAKTKEITLIKRIKKVSISPEPLESEGKPALLGFHCRSGFGCFLVAHQLDEDRVELLPEVAKNLKAVDAAQFQLIALI